MKVKIINKNTNQQFDCEEVEIDGYKYYLYYNTEPKKIGQYYINKDNQVDIVKTGKELGKPILCSNNPNIEIPKVVDEVDKISEEWFLINGYNQFDYIHSHRTPDAITASNLFKAGYNKSQETHPFSEQDMLDFVLWKDENKFSVISTKEDWVSELLEYSGCVYTTKELLQPWQEQQPKIVYYE